jgi:hypothetical protein
MKDCIFHTPEGWKWNKFPDKPDPLTYGRGQELIDSLNSHDKQVAELKASARKVANPEIIDADDINNGKATKDGELYRWTGEVKKERKAIVTKSGSAQYEMVAVLSLPKPEADLKEKNMETDLISWLTKLQDEDKLARIWCDLNCWDWPKDIPEKFKPQWWDLVTEPLYLSR